VGLKISFNKESFPIILEKMGYKIGLQGEVLDEYFNPVLDMDGNPFIEEEIFGIIDKMFITKESQMLGLQLPSTYI
jgi:hypothetical protein